MSVSPDDRVVIYYSKEDGCWIGHSLRTDQIGTGRRIVDALADTIRAVHQAWQVSQKDPSVAFEREAPVQVQRLAAESKKLPREIYEIAHKMVHGTWPEELDVQITARDENGSFTTELETADR
jgi:hypothetical protein